MTHFIIDDSDKQFCDLVCSNLDNRGLDWLLLSDDNAQATNLKNKYLIISSKSSNFDVKSKSFVDHLRKFKFVKAFVFTSNSETLLFKSECNGAIKELQVPKYDPQDSALFNFYLSLFIEQFSRNTVNLPCSDPETAGLVNLLARLAVSNASVLINGPTGTGKEVVSKLLHSKSNRKEGPFIAVNCAAIPENMLESMLFGHEKGSFTGAMHSNDGLFRAANSGTLLLDEISEMPMALQSKLLRVLQEKVVTPIGSSKEIPVDLRVIATTNRDMSVEIEQKRFREDLFYRLNVFPIATRALNLRSSDIPAISAHMLTRNTVDDDTPKVLSANALSRLMKYEWPGNVRELDNVLQRATILTNSSMINECDILFDSDLTVKTPNTTEALRSKIQAHVE
ncbi:sigma-54 dependent transcriptional regulator [Planktomarina sp.]|nr:sigma-54 dependent transcriptional regulator [Planktomarina sp.]MDA9100112.1 sigma-54 dependent transcriptional regulator [Planktomarina sp.]